MTRLKVSDFASAPQHSSDLSNQPQFGRCAYGPQPQVSQETLACYIAESIITHRQMGQDRSIGHYTPDPHLTTLVQAQLDALVVISDEVTQPQVIPPDVLITA